MTEKCPRWTATGSCGISLGGCQSEGSEERESCSKEHALDLHRCVETFILFCERAELEGGEGGMDVVVFKAVRVNGGIDVVLMAVNLSTTV